MCAPEPEHCEPPQAVNSPTMRSRSERSEAGGDCGEGVLIPFCCGVWGGAPVLLRVSTSCHSVTTYIAETLWGIKLPGKKLQVRETESHVGDECDIVNSRVVAIVDPEQIVRTDFRDGASRRVELDRDVYLLVELEGFHVTFPVTSDSGAGSTLLDQCSLELV